MFILCDSWGKQWGIGGYMMLARDRGNMCGVATLASFPTGLTKLDLDKHKPRAPKKQLKKTADAGISRLEAQHTITFTLFALYVLVLEIFSSCN